MTLPDGWTEIDDYWQGRVYRKGDGERVLTLNADMIDMALGVDTGLPDSDRALNKCLQLEWWGFEQSKPVVA